MSNKNDKPVVLTTHAKKRMNQRGATEDEVRMTVKQGVKKAAKRGKWHSTLRFDFKDKSTVTGKSYEYKTIDAVYAEETGRIVVVTVKVYYHNV